LEHTTTDKSKEKIQAMFDEIAPTYDKLNHLFTLKIDIKWRREIVKYLIGKKFHAADILDLASGTGDLTAELLTLDPKKIIAADISDKMLEVQRAKIKDTRLQLVNADSSQLPFEDDSFDLVTIGFGIRNFELIEKSLNEIRRVLKRGGKLIILEMFKGSGIKTKIFNLYFGKVMPFFGNRISKSKYAYSYLFKSVDGFYSVKDFINLCQSNGFKVEYSKNNFLGIVNTIVFEVS